MQSCGLEDLILKSSETDNSFSSELVKAKKRRFLFEVICSNMLINKHGKTIVFEMKILF